MVAKRRRQPSLNARNLSPRPIDDRESEVAESERRRRLRERIATSIATADHGHLSDGESVELVDALLRGAIEREYDIDTPDGRRRLDGFIAGSLPVRIRQIRATGHVGGLGAGMTSRGQVPEGRVKAASTSAAGKSAVESGGCTDRRIGSVGHPANLPAEAIVQDLVKMPDLGFLVHRHGHRPLGHGERLQPGLHLWQVERVLIEHASQQAELGRIHPVVVDTVWYDPEGE